MQNPYAAPNMVGTTEKRRAPRVIGCTLPHAAGFVVGWHIAWGFVHGFGSIAHSVSQDPIGLLARCGFVTLACVFVAECYRSLRRRLSSTFESHDSFDFPVGFVFGAATLLALWGFSEIIPLVFGTGIRGSSRMYIHMTLTAPAAMVASILAVELEQLVARLTRTFGDARTNQSS